MRIDEGLYCQR